MDGLLVVFGALGCTGLTAMFFGLFLSRTNKNVGDVFFRAGTWMALPSFLICLTTSIVLYWL